jgi:nucleotide-binding universal stress UspA family protein
MKRPQHIRFLVPIDFQEQSLNALEQSFVVAEHERATIELLYVVESADFISELFRTREHAERVEREALLRLDELADHYTEQYGVPVNSTVRSGKPAEIILNFANEINAQCIIMGRGQGKHLGTNASKVIEQAQQPIITVSGKDHKIGFKNVVLCMDLTQPSKEHLQQTILLGKHFNATVHVVSVLMGNVQASKSRIWTRMKRVETILQENGLNSEVKLIPRTEQSPYKSIVDYSHHINADLIAMMFYKKNSHDNYLGAFARQIINETDIPILIINHAIMKVEKPILTNFVDPIGVFEKHKKAKKLIPNLNLWISRKRHSDINV